MEDGVKNEIVIEPGRRLERYWRDLWEYRELFAFLAWRDLLVRYKQTVFGVSWSVLRPLLTMIVFTLIFGKLAKLPSEGVPYPILVFAAMLPWQFFANSVGDSSNSIVGNAPMISKIYFPRLLVLAGSMTASLVDFLISFAILALLMAWYRFLPGAGIVALPVFLSLIVLFSLGCSMWFAALNVKYRDFRYVVPFILQAGLYISPVGFSSSIVPPEWRMVYSLNPMVGAIEGFRWALLAGDAPFPWQAVVASVVLSLLIFVSGFRYFRNTERTFADII